MIERGNPKAGSGHIRIWIATEDGFPRKMAIEAAGLGFKTTFHYYDFNSEITIHPPSNAVPFK